MGSTYVVEQLLFSIVPSILTFDFDLILGSFLAFWGPNGLFSGLRWGLKNVFGSPHVAEQILFSMFPSILTLDYSLNLRSFLTFGGSNGLFWGQDLVQELFWGLLI